jgi:hypothetical protein
MSSFLLKKKEKKTFEEKIRKHLKKNTGEYPSCQQFI